MKTIEKNHQLIPVQIRPYLIPFIMNEFLVKEEALFEGVQAKIVDISIHNSIGKIIRLMCTKADLPIQNLNKFSVFIRVKNQHRKNKWKANVYKYSSGSYSFLNLPEEGADIINEHFENIFSQSLLCFLEGYLNSDSNQGLRKGIDIFMQRYNLYDFEIDPETLRRAYYRYEKKEKRLSFYCNKKSKKRIRCHT